MTHGKQHDANAPTDLAYLLSECDRKDSEIAALKDAAIRGEGYHKRYDSCLKELDDKDAENAVLRKALKMGISNACSATGIDMIGCPPHTGSCERCTSRFECWQEYYIQQAREAIEHEKPS